MAGRVLHGRQGSVCRGAEALVVEAVVLLASLGYWWPREADTKFGPDSETLAYSCVSM